MMLLLARLFSCFLVLAAGTPFVGQSKERPPRAEGVAPHKHRADLSGSQVITLAPHGGCIRSGA